MANTDSIWQDKKIHESNKKDSGTITKLIVQYFLKTIGVPLNLKKVVLQDTIAKNISFLGLGILMFTSTFVKKLSLSAVGAACLSLGAAGSVQAITLSPGAWNSFIFGDVGEVANPGTFDFTVPTQGGILKVTDSYSVGDAFDIFNLGILLGATPFVEQGETITGDPDEAYADSNYSSGSFILAAGNYSISIKPSVSPAQIGKAYIRWDAATIPTDDTELPTDNGGARSVPEPNSVLSMLALGAIGVVSNLKRKLQVKDQ